MQMSDHDTQTFASMHKITNADMRSIFHSRGTGSHDTGVPKYHEEMRNNGVQTSADKGIKTSNDNNTGSLPICSTARMQTCMDVYVCMHDDM